MFSSADIRQGFLSYFEGKGHSVVRSASLVPGNDPTLLFTNAGMVPFKDVFTGREQRPYTRASSAQRCVRAGGKHNDLENVGYTARHHTFFEMLGNFSFGDYFKREAIQYAWEFLTQVVKLPAEKLWVTVYEEDDEAADIWLKEIGVDPARFSRIGAKDNFWSMGDTGPCGPCTEIFYDHGPEIPGGPPGTPEEDGDRYIEIWNLVFMQYDRDVEGTLHPLPKPCVDTGMGLERLAAVVQGVHSNYEIDLFQKLIRAAAELAGVADLENSSLRVIADHIRACSFLIADGVFPSNEGRGYVLRRIVRRAVRHGYQLGIAEPFFHRLVPTLVAEMGEAYPELVENQDQVARMLRQEEERFRETLEQGMKLLDEDLARLSGREIPGETIFRLYDTYGFPVDLTGDIARERELTLDMAGFEACMEEQRARARSASRFKADHSQAAGFEGRSEFTGYENLQGQGSVTGLFREGRTVNELRAGEQGMVVLDRTPFYAESGGQVGDQGWLRAEGLLFEVQDTVKYGAAHGHLGVLREGSLKLDQALAAQVNAETRARTVANHSATHLLHAVLREVLGEHVQQKGSLVAPDRLRFDFAHFEAIASAQLHEIEDRVNARIRANVAAEAAEMGYDEAIEAGAVALFGEKYGDKVRVLSLGEYSTELCGGTHVSRTGDIGLFKIIAEGGVAAGVRRIEALTGEGALAWVREAAGKLNEAAALLKSSPENLGVKLNQLLDRNRQLEKELARLQQTMASAAGSDLAAQAVDVKGVKVLAAQLDAAQAKSLRETVDQLKQKLGSAVILLGAAEGGKVKLVAGVSQDCTDRVKAGELVNSVATQVGGRGGGRPDFAQAGGSEPDKLPQAIQEVVDWVSERL
ncbi:alanine--tRNA ligase [Alkalilimnicola sp. S0819]|uniref:alanine--tRNA ligase n=1 Tax=Alkalilimnicola sp. S0819 TaxID=2613922 RepID=UPI001261E7C5|nr:alanine--tRNA ligase [Alkalilimnicola sp. S0819]KAB7619736.1 alanine--tRNA ligase [Alkalilimnicola sp. S0819]MPQ17500.1 alanine--tRNA ligase [Alkalilimnicola sp. S0819]